MNLKNIDWKMVGLWLAFVPGMVVALDGTFHIWNLQLLEYASALALQVAGLCVFFFSKNKQ